MDQNRKQMVTLKCMSKHCDGAHCGLADWYPEIEKGIQKALKRGPSFNWTTGWYSSKKEIASACITQEDGFITVKVSVSDDFDTLGMGEEVIKHTNDLNKICDAIYKAWNGSEKDQKANQLYVGYSILTKVKSYGLYIGGKGQGKPHYGLGWVETYIKPSGDGYCFDSPPGDNYHKWGFQGEYRIPKIIKKKLANWAENHDTGKFKCGKFIIQPWED